MLDIVSLKILHVIPSLSRVHGGPSQAIRTMQSCLTHAGVLVDVATTDDDGLGRRSTEAYENSCQTQFSGREFFFRKQTEFYKVSFGFARWIFAAVRRYDVVHIHALFSFTSVLAALAARIRGVPYILHPIGTLANYGLSNRRPHLKRMSIALIEGPLLRNAAAVHFTSDAEMKDALQLGIPINAVVIALAITPNETFDQVSIEAQFPTLAGCVVVLYLSRLDPQKNVESLLTAFAECRRYDSNLRLLVAGDGHDEYVGKLRHLAAKLNIADAIVWAGFVSGVSKAAALAKAHFFVLPSHADSFGIAAVEALAEGIPCLLSNGVGVAKDAVECGAAVMTTTDASSIGAALRDLLHDKVRQVEMSVRGKEFVEKNYSTKQMAQRLIALYNQVR